MGLLLSKLSNLLSELGRGRERRLLMLGLDAAGKTTILYKVKLNEAVTTIPTIGFNVEEVHVGKGLSMTIWDVGGQGKIRELWRHYFTNCEGLLFVVDSNDRERLEEAREALCNVLEHELMREVPVVVLANKQDLPQAMSVSEIMQVLDMDKLGRKTGGSSSSGSRKWFIQACCATSGEGLYEGIREMANLSDVYVKSRRRGY